ncbi:RAD50-interacting protein 1 isoform X2 [Cimex lectularius]|nr:RAD50-interacting protein 1 isoform X2 [Cimex lectularius]
MSNELTLKVCDQINKELGDEVENLSKCRKMYEDALAKKKRLEQLLSLVSDEVPSKVAKAKKMIDDACDDITKASDEVTSVLKDIRERLGASEKLYWQLKESFDKINTLNNTRAYLQILEFVQQISDRIESHILGRDVNLERAIVEYKRLCEMCLKLKGSACEHLITFLIDTTKYWHKALKSEISAEFDIAMKNVMWPIVSRNLLNTPTPDSITKFQNGIKRLLRIQLPPGLEEKSVVTTSLALNFPELSIPITELIKPLKKRFLYHFTGSRQTNRLDKPEWYFTQILSWIRDHEDFIDVHVQPVFDHVDYQKSASVEFICGLVQLSVEKLQCDIEEVQFDDLLFSHVVDEALGYERELRSVYNYPQSFPGPTQVLTQAQIFVKWIKMERKYARDKMDAMMASETAWSTLAGQGDEDKVTEVAHTFLALLSTMTDRYTLLPQPGHRLQFVELELELIDDLRVSLLQVLHSERSDPLNSKLPEVLNTIFHLKVALEHFDASPAILLLEHYRKQYNPVEDGVPKKDDEDERGGLFKNSLLLLERLVSGLLNDLCDALMLEVKARSRPYRKDKWFAMTEEDVDMTMVTQSACSMFQALVDNLHLVHKKLSFKLFNSYWKLVANNLNMFLLEDLILDTHFSPYGGQALEKDIINFLIPIFQTYTDVPETYFLQVEEAACLLGLEEVSDSCRRSILTGNINDVVKDLGRYARHLKPEQIMAVIRRRMDIAPSIM